MPTSITIEDSTVPLLLGEGPDTLQTFPSIHPEPGLPSIPGYEVLNELGRGGMGVVYKARDLKLKRLVAIKMLLDPEFASPEQRLRFRIEAEAVAQLKHPNIVQVYELGELPGSKSDILHPFMVLEYVEGPTLYSQMRRHPFTERAAAALMVTLARAMQHAHDHGLIHRDLKPANILLSPESLVLSPESGQTQHSSPLNTQDSALRTSLSPKITDFGLVKTLVFEGEGCRDLTRPELMVGTPQYMAPEQANPSSKALSCAVDIYSLGVILYELLTGHLPYDDKDILKMLMDVQMKEPISPRKHQPRLSIDLETIALKCLEKDPKRRYASAAALADDLTRFLHHEPIQARPLSEWQRVTKWAQRHPAIASLAGLLFTVITAALIVIATLWRQADADRQQAVDHSIDADIARDIARSAEQQARQSEKGALESEKQTQQALYFSRISQADLLLRQGQLIRTRQILRDIDSTTHADDPRSWEWFHLVRLCQPMEQFLATSSDYVQKVEFHPTRPLLFNIQGAEYFGDAPPERYPGKLIIHQLDQAGKEWKPLNQYEWKFPLRDLRLPLQGSKILLRDMNEHVLIFNTDDLLTPGSDPRPTSIPPDLHWTLADDAGIMALWDNKKPSPDLKLFDIKQGKVTRTLRLPGEISNVNISRDGRVAVFALKSYTIGVWNLEDDSLCWKLQLPQGDHRIALSANGMQAACLSFPAGELIWLEARTGKTIFKQSGVPGDYTWLAPEGDRLALNSFTNDGEETVVWRRQTNGVIDTVPLILRGHKGQMTSHQFSANGDRFVTTGNDGSVRLWDTGLTSNKAGVCLQDFRGHTGTVLTAAFDPQGDSIASGGIDANVLLWNTKHNVVHDLYQAGDGCGGEWLSSYAFIEGTPLLALFDQLNGRLLHMDLQTRAIVKRLPIPNVFTVFRAPRYDSSFSGDGKLFAASDKTMQRVLLVDVLTGQEHWTTPQLPFKLLKIQISSDGKRLLAAGHFPHPTLANRAIPYRCGYQVWDITARKLIHEGELPRASTSWAINHDGSRIAVSLMPQDRKVELTVLDINNQGRPVFTVPFDFNRCICLAFSPDGKQLAGINFDPFNSWITLRDAQTGKELWKKDAVHESVDVAFTPDSRRVLFTSYDSNVVMLDVRNGHEVLTLKHHGNPRKNDYALSPKIVFKSDATRLAIHSWDAGLTIWHARDSHDKASHVIPAHKLAE